MVESAPQDKKRLVPNTANPSVPQMKAISPVAGGRPASLAVASCCGSAVAASNSPARASSGNHAGWKPRSEANNNGVRSGALLVMCGLSAGRTGCTTVSVAVRLRAAESSFAGPLATATFGRRPACRSPTSREFIWSWRQGMRLNVQLRAALGGPLVLAMLGLLHPAPACAQGLTPAVIAELDAALAAVTAPPNFTAPGPAIDPAPLKGKLI